MKLYIYEYKCNIYTYVCMYIYTYVCIYKHIYIYRERDIYIYIYFFNNYLSAEGLTRELDLDISVLPYIHKDISIQKLRSI
jgi:hypothetical protein